MGLEIGAILFYNSGLTVFMEAARSHSEEALFPFRPPDSPDRAYLVCVGNQRFLTLFEHLGNLFYKDNKGNVGLLTPQRQWMREGMSLLNRQGTWVLHTMDDADIVLLRAMVSDTDRDAADKITNRTEPARLPTGDFSMAPFYISLGVASVSGMVVGGTQLYKMFLGFESAQFAEALKTISTSVGWK